MATEVYHFFNLGNDVFRPLILTKIINPKNRKSFKFWSLLDTGADKCVFPLGLCNLLEIDLKTGNLFPTKGVDGNITNTWEHPFKIEVLKFNSEALFWRSKELQIGCLEHDNISSILGWEGCMEFFNIRFNYASKRITIEI